MPSRLGLYKEVSFVYPCSDLAQVTFDDEPNVVRECPLRLVMQIGIHAEVAAKIKQILHFIEEPKDDGIDPIVKSFHKKSGIHRTITDALQKFGVEVIIIDDDDVARVNCALEYLQYRQKSGEDTIAFIHYYIGDEQKNADLLEHEFPCPVAFHFCKKQTWEQTASDRAIEKACNEEFGIGSTIVQTRISQINENVESYLLFLRGIISICSNEEDINRRVVESFDENVDEENLLSFACSVWLHGDPNTPHRFRNWFTVNDYKSKLVHKIITNFCEKISGSILTKLSNHIQKQINTKAFDAVRSHVAHNRVGSIASNNIFEWIYDSLLAEIRSAILTCFIPLDINSRTWRKQIVTMTHKSLLEHRSDILKELDKQYQVIFKDITHQLRRELQEASDLILPILPYIMKGRSGCQLTSASCGMDEFGKTVIGLRAENFDHFYVSYEKGMDIFIDQRTVKESTMEMQLVDDYIDNKLEENDRIRVDIRRKLNEVVRKYTPELMKKHSNLVTISTSPVISHRGNIERKPCIVIYCSCKGVTPFGERQFPRELEGMPVDVREGYVYFGSARGFHDPLRLGCSIGTSGEFKSGSVGVFVTEVDTPDQYGLLTCGHVLLPRQELINPRIRTNVSVDVVQPSFEDDPQNRMCGRLIDAKFGNVVYKGEFTGVDYAYVKMINRIPQVLRFPSVEREHTEASLRDGYQEETTMGPPIRDLDYNDIEQSVYKFGRTSGFTRGVFNFHGAALRRPRLSSSLNPQLPQDSVEHHLLNQYNIESFRRVFFEPGDSGASVFVRKGRNRKVHVIGLAVGCLCNGRECFVTPIGAVLDSIVPRIEIQCFPK